MALHPSCVPAATRSVTERIAVHTRDMDEFVAVVNALFGPHRLRLGAGGLAGSVQGHRCGQLIVGQLNYGTEAHSLVEQERDGWVMTHPVGADGAWDSRRFAPDELMMYAPQWCGRIGMRGDTWMRNTFVPLQTLQQNLGDLLGSVPQQDIQFEQRLPLNASEAERLRQVSSLLQDPHGPASRPAPVQRAWESTFCMELLTLWPHSFSQHLRAVQPALPRALRRACDAIDAHLRLQPEQALPVAALARAAAVGVRALELAFRKHLGTSPLRYVRNRRLEGARADLNARSPGARLRVADVALKWGFSNPGQFARAYYQRFGELPGRRRK